MDDALKMMLKAVRAAGAAILELQLAGVTIEQKANNEIVTQADLLANELLRKPLLHHFPNVGWLSEETVDDASRLSCERVWIIDPIDGTREYSQGIAEYAISVALIEKGIPIVAVVFNPATQELFHAVKNQGAWQDKQRLSCRHYAPKEPLVLLASRSEYKRGEWAQFQTQHTVEPLGSIAYKLGLVAAGKADATFSLGRKNEWDIAAGTLLVQEAGGIVTNKHQETLLFNRENVNVDGIVATSATVNSAVFRMITESL